MANRKALRYMRKYWMYKLWSKNIVDTVLLYRRKMDNENDSVSRCIVNEANYEKNDIWNGSDYRLY